MVTRKLQALTGRGNMDVSLVTIDKDDRNVLENLFHYYIYEMSDFLALSPNQDGHFGYNKSQFDIYWKSECHLPYFIYVDQELAGFVLIRKYPSDPSINDIEQFFVLRKFNGKGVGKRAFKLVTQLISGNWQIRVLIENSRALHFWESSVSNIVGQNYTQSKSIDIDLLMFFIQFEVAS
ncbi:GNAT family N-acetyltransferase [Photobacterium profundum]|nr:GNAT family N-acetyltransferase [Photobacterium profundum]